MLIFTERRSPESIKMKKGGLISVHHGCSCPITYVIRNVLLYVACFYSQIEQPITSV